MIFSAICNRVNIVTLPIMKLVHLRSSLSDTNFDFILLRLIWKYIVYLFDMNIFVP